MTSTKLVFWAFVFTVLIVFTSFVITGKSINPEVAYAAEIQQQFANSNDSVFIAVQDKLDVSKRYSRASAV